jgi:undecaprenyl-diphosphatase
VRRGRTFVRVYAALVILVTVAFVALAFLVRDTNLLARADVAVTEAIQGVHLPLYGWVLTHTSDLGFFSPRFFPLNVVAYVVVFAAFVALRLRLEAVLAVAASLLAGLVGGGIRLAVGRMRPSGPFVHVAGHLSGYSFPSGHVIQYTTLFGFAFYVVFVAWRGGTVRALVLAVLAALVTLVGPSRVYLGEHWPSDVLGAYLFASLWLAGTIEVHLFLKPRIAMARAQRHRSSRQEDAHGISSHHQ